MSAAAPRRDEPLAEGLLIRGQYRLIEQIGSGGMGEVWRARDLLRERAGDPEADIALKLLHAEYADREDLFVALQREAKNAHKLAHPNVLTVFDFQVDESLGRPFISMELLRGEPLDAVIEAPGLGRGAVPIIRGIAAGLAYAHQKGYVHADMKPANVFLTRDGVPKILDFGIARAMREVAADEPRDQFDIRTVGGLTVAYASPEMLGGADAIPADDVFALGLIAFELVNGSLPFGRKRNDELGARPALPPLPGLRPWEKRAIRRSLAMPRAARWQDAAAFERAMRPPVRTAWIAGLTLATLLAGGGAAWLQAIEAAAPDPIEALPQATQQQVRHDLADGDTALAEARRRSLSLVDDAVKHYGNAYALHPLAIVTRSAGFTGAADLWIKQTASLPAGDRLEELLKLSRLSAFYEGYEPLKTAVERARQGR